MKTRKQINNKLKGVNRKIRKYERKDTYFRADQYLRDIISLFFWKGAKKALKWIKEDFTIKTPQDRKFRTRR